jgi:hypothetical protein
MKTATPPANPTELPEFIEALRDRAITAGDTLAGQYLACVCGMWSHVCNVSLPVFEKKHGTLEGWWVTGFTASMNCVAMRQRAK